MLKKRKACGKKWSQVTTGNCKNGISASLRGKKVGAYCKKSCGGCGKYIYTSASLLMLSRLIGSFLTLIVMPNYFIGGNDADDLKSAFERIKQLEDQMKDLKDATSSICAAVSGNII